MISTAMCTSFKVEVLRALHNFDTGTGDLFKIALYGAAASLGEDTIIYTPVNEIVATGYIAGGMDLVTISPSVYNSTGAAVNFVDALWTSTDIVASGALIYNSTKGNRAVMTLSFGSPQYSVAAGFLVVFPTAPLGIQ